MKVTDGIMEEVLASVKGDRYGALVVEVNLAPRTTISSVPSSEDTRRVAKPMKMRLQGVLRRRVKCWKIEGGAWESAGMDALTSWR